MKKKIVAILMPIILVIAPIFKGNSLIGITWNLIGSIHVTTGSNDNSKKTSEQEASEICRVTICSNGSYELRPNRSYDSDKIIFKVIDSDDNEKKEIKYKGKPISVDLEQGDKVCALSNENITSTDGMDEILNKFEISKIDGNNISGRTTQTGHITNSGTEIYHHYTASTSGLYNIQVEGDDVEVLIYPAGTDDPLDVKASIENTLVPLEKGEEYSIVVKSYADDVDYAFTVIPPNKTESLTDTKQYTKTLSYKGQVDIYTYIPTHTGVHRFETKPFSDTEAPLFIQVYQGEYIGEDSNRDYIDCSDEGITLELEKNEQYTIKVISNSEDSIKYTMIRYEQRAENSLENLVECSTLGQIRFKGERCLYNFEAEESGNYNFILNDCTEDIPLDIKLYKQGPENDIIGQNANELREQPLEAGQSYLLYIEDSAKNGPAEFTLNISKIVEEDDNY